jgi:methionyl-tRNA formyltransferase
VFDPGSAARDSHSRRLQPRLLAGSAIPQPQDLSRGSYFGGRRPEDGRIDWRQPAQAVHNLVRAVAPPYPGAFSPLADGTLRVLRTRLEPSRTARPGGPGLYFDGDALFADCADGRVLRLLEYDTQGARLNPASSGKIRLG